jgi:tetratricopeptide (TPR) repeat protein
MEILRKSVVIALLIASQCIQAQDQKAVQEAFVKSYALETAKKQNEAIDVLKSLNNLENYPTQLRLAWLYYSSKRYDESVAAYKKAAGLMPASIEALLGIVNPLAVQKKWNEVEQIYLSILKIDPKNSQTNFRLGQIYYNRKEYAKADKYFSASLNLYPFDYDSMLMCGWNCYFLGKYSEAKELFNRVLLYSPSDASAKEGLGLIK